MKKTLRTVICAVLALLMTLSAASVSFAASNEPTTEEMEKVLKIVKPKLDIPEEATEFSWNYRAGNVYNDANWVFTWSDKESKDGDRKSYTVVCDADGHITNYDAYIPYSVTNAASIVPSATKDEYKEKADAYLAKLNPEAAKSFTLVSSRAGSTRRKTYTYEYVRTENGYNYPDNTATVTLSYNDGSLRSYSIIYNYDAKFDAPEKVIGEEEAKKILSTKQSMKLRYISDYVTEDDKTTVKALLVYAPENGYASVNAVTGEVYDSVSSWEVRMGGLGGGDSANSSSKAELTENAAADEEADYELTESELAQKDILAKLITKDDAIKAVTGNKYLLINEALTAVDASLRKNYQTPKSYYQDDSGSYIWNIGFSNPILEDSGDYFNYLWMNASVNADNGKLVSFSADLRDMYYYTESKTPLPEVKYTKEEAQKIAEEFLKATCPEKFENSVLSGSYEENIIAYKDSENMTDPVYGAYSFRYVRVNEGVEYNANSISVGIDGVTGKVYRYRTNWNTNIEFESPKGVITPEKALETYVALGTDIRYETNTTYIYTPANETSKKDISKAFVYSLMTNIENGGDISKVIDKYAKDIDREKLTKLISDGNEDALLKFIEEYFGVTLDEKELKNDYRDVNDFYSKEEEIRLVYLVDAGSTAYIDAFDGSALDYSGDPVTAEESGYKYDDISGHWAEKTIALLGEIGIGFDGGKFEPDKAITGKEFCKLADSLSFSLWRSEKPIYSLKDSDTAATRLNAVKYVLTSIDYDKVAVLKNIFRTDFLDNAEIKEEDIGYVAIAYALGMVKGDGETMRTYDELTRAEALILLVNAAAAVK